MKELVFLPDRDGRDELSEQAGFVRLGADASSLDSLVQRLAAPVRATAAVDDTAWRGVLTLALLTDVWADFGAKVTIVPVDMNTSSFAAWVLASERSEQVQLVLLECGDRRCLLGTVDPETGLRLPASALRLSGCVPAAAAWIDAETGGIGDPIPFLNERDRAILIGRMEQMGLTAPCAAAYIEALRHADAAETDAVRCGDAEALECLAVRMEAVHGLTGFDALSVEKKRYAAAGCNPLAACLGADPADLRADLGESCTYLWHGVPFACTSSGLGLTGTDSPDMEAALAEITEELTLLSVNSVSWNHRTGTALQRWLDERKNDGALLPQARVRIEASCALLRENGRQVQSAVQLTWPWDQESGAVRLLLQEALGDEWLAGAEKPFADRLTKLTGHVLGDTVLQTCCACADGVLLPPLSREMAACVAAAEPGSGLAADTLRFQPQEDGGITASFLLRGKGEVLMSRSYGADEILVLEEAESPCVAMWPCLPMADWHAYHVFVRGSAQVAALSGGQWRTAVDAEGGVWRCLRAEQYPACLSLMRDGECLGALPNALPVFKPERSEELVAAIDLGSSQTAVAFAVNGEVKLYEGQELTRLLVTPQEMAPDALLAGLTPASVIPTAVMVTGAGDELFTDGFACRTVDMAALAGMDASALRTTLKWRSDAESVRARRLLMHQVMLGASLTAVLEGAKSIAWRITIADEMADEGREAIVGMMEELAGEVAEESGLPVTAGQKAVTWAEESAALCARLREESAVRGSYVAVDLGGGSTKLHLWLQGQSRPAAGSVLLEGVQGTLMNALMNRPGQLIDDFADCGDERLLQAVLAIADQMNPDMAGPRQTDKLNLMLDSMLDSLRPEIVRHLNARFAAQRPTYTQAVLLETEAAILFIVGLMLAQAGDNSLVSHRLPEDIPVCLTGRGAWLLDTLTPAMRNSLQALTHAPMRLDHPVRFVSLRSAARPAQSVAMGLAVTRDVEHLSETPLVRTRESFTGLMQRLMQQLLAAFPMHMWLLHEGLFDWQGNLTPAGDDAIRATASRCYGDGEDIPAAIMDFMRGMRAIDLNGQQG
ncbi:MAG: hypothetical protein E7327_09875 [Clostridiales bacterium]|nr:hypothetical protein [Clostridiales bacterium]